MDWHAREAGEVLQELLSDEAHGLTRDEAVRRLARHGPNRLPEPPARSGLQRFLLQFHDPLIYVLVAAAAVTLWLDHRVDAAVILGVVVVNAIIGFVQEGKAERALEAVRAMLASRALVLRDGERHEIDAQTLVPGDIVLLESGSRIPADLRLLRTVGRTHAGSGLRRDRGDDGQCTHGESRGRGTPGRRFLPHGARRRLLR